MLLPPTLSLPTAIQTALWVKRPTWLLELCGRRFGDVFRLKLPKDDLVLVSDPAVIKQIFTGDPEVFRAGEVNLILEPVVGPSSVLMLDGKAHLRKRKLLHPPFHGERMQLYARTMQCITEDTTASWRENEVFELLPHALHITLDLALRTIFGVDERDELEELRAAMTRLLSGGAGSALMLLFPALRRDLGPLTPYRRFRQNLDNADALIRAQIARRRQRNPVQRRDDVLALLMDAKDEQGQPFGDSELRDELVTLLLAGHVTTSTALSWAFERVLSTPRVYSKLRAELDAVLGGEKLGPEHLPRLEYMDACITEALRLRPVAPLVSRKLREPFQLKQWLLPAGTVVAPSVYLTQRRADLYPSPEEFRPERFLGTRADPYAWLPFGGGTRRCPGAAYAMYELKVMMATMLSRFDFELAQPAPVRVVRGSLFFLPEHGLKVRVRRREPAALAG